MPKSKGRKKAIRRKAKTLASRVSTSKAKLLKREAKRAPHIAGGGKKRRMNKAVTRQAVKIKKRQRK